MKSKYQVAIAALAFSWMVFAPAFAHASKTPGSAHVRGVSYHDRTPRVRTREAHPHR
jgi:hypothetical protein